MPSTSRPRTPASQRRIDQTTPGQGLSWSSLADAGSHAHVVVLGDFNGFQFETAQTQLESSGNLENLTNLLAPTDRYSFSFGGNMEQIDQLYASTSLQNGAQFDIVHLNTGQSDATRDTDHDPIVSAACWSTALRWAWPTTPSRLDRGRQALTVDAAHGVLANDTDADHDTLHRRWSSRDPATAP